jgi:hypothetical protein
MDLLDKIGLFTFNGTYEAPVVEGDKAAYDKFVKGELEKTGKSLGDMDDEETKKFFAMIDKKWKGDDEKANEDMDYEEEEEEEEDEVMNKKKKDDGDGET